MEDRRQGRVGYKTPSEPVGNGSVVDGAGDGANNSGNGREPEALKTRLKRKRSLADRKPNLPTDAGKEFVADDGGAASRMLRRCGERWYFRSPALPKLQMPE